MIDRFIRELNKPVLSDYIVENSELYEDLLHLSLIQYWNGVSVLYEARANTEYVVNDLTGNLVRTGRVNLIGYALKNDDDIIKLSKIIGNKKFETSRILYTKNGVIVGQDAVTIDIPNVSLVHAEKSDKIAFEKIKMKMDRVGADGYYMIHNHPSGDSNVSQDDIRACRYYAWNLNGFLGEIVVGKDNFSIITLDKETLEPRVEYKGSFEDDRPLLNDWISVIDYLKEMHKEPCNSYVIYADNRLRLISIQRISDKEFNDKNIFHYLSNEKHNNGAVNCYLYTTVEDIYKKACMYTGGEKLFTDVFISDGDYYKSARVERDNLGQIVRDEPIKTKKL